MSRLQSAFVTGAGGFIGQNLVRQLVSEKVSVVALMLPGESIPNEWRETVKVVIGDVRQLRTMSKEIGKVDAIFHLAAVVSDWGAQQTHIDITVNGTEQAIDLAKKWGAHFIVTTSVCAYASELANGLLTESSATGEPSSPYEFCKQEQERVTLEAVNNFKLKATIIRPGNVYGVGSGPWVNTLVEMMKQGKPCRIGSGEWDAGLVHVKNLVTLLISAARSNFTDGDIFIGSDGLGITWKTYLDRLSAATGAPKPKSIPNIIARNIAPVLEWIGHFIKQKQRPLITRQSYRLVGGSNEFSTQKSQKLLGYKPVVSFEEAMEELAAHFTSQNA